MRKAKDKSRVELGKKLRVARLKAGLSQAKLAKAAGLSANHYAVVERGEHSISFERLEQILKVLNIKTLDIQ